LIGAYMTAVVNKIANQMTGFNREEADPDFQFSYNVYPGDGICSVEQPHSKWHEESANGLVDVALLTNSGLKAMNGGELRLGGESELLDCYMARDNISESEVSNWITFTKEVSTAFQDCLLIFLKGWPTPNVGNFLSCMFTKVVAENARTNDSASLVSCLVQNQCIAFNGITLNLPRLLNCIGLNNAVRSIVLKNRLFFSTHGCHFLFSMITFFFQKLVARSSPCGSFVRQSRTLLCVLSCGKSQFCAVSCLQKALALPWFNQMISCLMVLFNPNTSNRAILNQCLRANVGESATSSPQARIANGLVSLVNRTVTSCQDVHNAFLQNVNKFSACAQSCRSSGLFSTLKDSVPEVVLCAHYCLITVAAEK